jgi:ribosome-associated protein
LLDTNVVLEACVEALVEKKGSEIIVLDVRGLTLIADYFVIATGKSVTQLQALARHVEEKMEERDIKPLRVEGFREAQWILLDYGQVVVHLFLPEQREFYNLERLWGDATVITEIP